MNRFKPELYDVRNEPLHIGDLVVYGDCGTLMIGTLEHVTKTKGSCEIRLVSNHRWGHAGHLAKIKLSKHLDQPYTHTAQRNGVIPQTTRLMKVQ